MELSIVIVSWNTCELLVECLDSIYRDPPPVAFEILVVDNASNDLSVPTIRERFPQVRVIENKENIGFARANNQAIRLSAGRYVLLLNPDTVVRTGALNILLQFLETHPQVGAVGPRLLNPDGSLQPSCYPAPTLSRELWRLFHLDRLYPYGIYHMDRWNVEDAREVEVLKGACILLPRNVLDQVGLLSEEYFMYSEEVDLCYSLRKAKWRLYWEPEAIVVHYGGQSTQQAATEMFLNLYQGKLLYFRRHYGRLAGWIYKLILLFASASRLLIMPLTIFEGPVRRKNHRELAQKYWQLIGTIPGL